jgi:glucosamine-6-phosphate deaminase
MKIQVFDSRQEMASVAAENAASIIRESITARGHAYLIAATGASQFEFLDELMNKPKIDWKKTTFFHLDEYVGLPESHRASFRRYLRERIVDRVRPGTFHFINGDAASPKTECLRVGQLISRYAIDAAFVGIGENGHLAFNDPPADFETHEPYLVVDLDQACRQQQVGEGWFDNPGEVPTQAISMSIQQIIKSINILCVVPDRRKAEAVKDCLKLDISPLHPASILQRHERTTIYLDRDSASLLSSGD